MKNKHRLMEKISLMNPNCIFISTVTVSELEYGAAKSNWGLRTRANMQNFLSPFTIIPFNSNDAVLCGRIRAYLAQRGTPIGSYDVMIAAQGISRNFIIVTHNTKEFSRIQNIRLEDWVSS